MDMNIRARKPKPRATYKDGKWTVVAGKLTSRAKTVNGAMKGLVKLSKMVNGALGCEVYE